jgi:hypothetical protein
MADLQQVPGQLNITVTAIDDMSIALDFDISLTGYTFTAFVQTVTASTAITVTAVSLANGQITLSLTNTQLTTIGVGYHEWYLAWNDGTNDRRVLAGNFTILAA